MVPASPGQPAPPRPAQPPPLPMSIDPRRDRRLAAGFAALGGAALLVAAFLDPYDAAGRPRTHGTHRQLGLPACTLKSLTGIGCPACGMTTAFALLMHGDPVAAWETNWAGCAIAALTLAGSVWFASVAAGMPPGRFTTDETVKALAFTGMALGLARWLATIVAMVARALA